MKLELHFAPQHLLRDIPSYDFTGYDELIPFLLAETETCGVVYLISVFDEVYVTEYIHPSITFIQSTIDRFYQYATFTKENPEPTIKIFFQEYDSFEDAYEVAFTMKEGVTDLLFSE